MLFHAYGYGRVPDYGDPAGPKSNPGGGAKGVDDVGPDYAQLPGSGTVVVYSWRKDNEGPPNATEVLSDFADCRAWFPGADVIAGTLDEFVSEVSPSAKSRLPVITTDLSDSWLMVSPQAIRQVACD